MCIYVQLFFDLTQQQYKWNKYTIIGSAMDNFSEKVNYEETEKSFHAGGK